MQRIFWLAPDRVAGRTGPSKDPWNLLEMREHGFTAVLSVNDGAFCHAKDIEAAGMRYKCQPLSPNAPPKEGDLEHCLHALPLALQYVVENERGGGATLVHCHWGKDRTGLFLAYYAAKIWKYPPHQAIAAVKAVRPIALSAAGWDEFAVQVLSTSGV